MVPLAATATPTGTDDTGVYAVLLLLLLIVTLGYFLGCWL